MKKVILSVVIVTYNNENHIITCLSSLPWKHLPTEVLWIDNGSKDRTRKMVEEFCHQSPECTIKKLCNPSNRGFACGVNQGLVYSKGDFILLLGPDTRVLPGSTEAMIDFLKTHPEVGLVAPQLIDSENRILPSCRRFPTYRDLFCELSGLLKLFPNRFPSQWKMNDFNHLTQREVDQPEATCLLTHRKALRDVGSMDERFFMFFNDVDWCRRFWSRGWKVVFYPQARIQHTKGASVFPHRLPMIWRSHQGFYRYFEKYAVFVWQRALNQILKILLILAATFRSLPFFLGLKNSVESSLSNNKTEEAQK